MVVREVKSSNKVALKFHRILGFLVNFSSFKFILKQRFGLKTMGQVPEIYDSNSVEFIST